MPILLIEMSETLKDTFREITQEEVDALILSTTPFEVVYTDRLPFSIDRYQNLKMQIYFHRVDGPAHILREKEGSKLYKRHWVDDVVQDEWTGAYDG